MSSPFGDAITIIENLWATGWVDTSDIPIPVLWHSNTSEIVPSRSNTDYWLHLSVEFDDEVAVAFGQGPFQTERELRGCVIIRVFAGRGTGETQSLVLLDRALTVFRGHRVGALSFIGDIVQQMPGASDDGGWWLRSAIASFVMRFKG
jgi:hypothetical protein